MDSLIVAVRVVVSLGVVLAVLWYLHRRISRTRTRAAGDIISVVGRQTVGQKSSVVIVEMDGRRLLLGVTEQAISVLHSEARDAVVVEETSFAAASGSRFAQVMTAAVAAPPRESRDFSDAYDETVRNVVTDTDPAARVRPETTSFPTRRDARRRGSRLADVTWLQPTRTAPEPSGMLAGSILSAATWKHAAVALRRAL